jgi:5-methyltetrahydrofolate--homocysteine methyltransferase
VYFTVGKLGADQLHDQARRRGRDLHELERLLAPNL